MARRIPRILASIQMIIDFSPKDQSIRENAHDLH